MRGIRVVEEDIIAFNVKEGILIYRDSLLDLATKDDNKCITNLRKIRFVVLIVIILIN